MEEGGEVSASWLGRRCTSAHYSLQLKEQPRLSTLKHILMEVERRDAHDKKAPARLCLPTPDSLAGISPHHRPPQIPLLHINNQNISDIQSRGLTGLWY
jgi:hypothetical protein